MRLSYAQSVRSPYIFLICYAVVRNEMLYLHFIAAVDDDFELFLVHFLFVIHELISLA